MNANPRIFRFSAASATGLVLGAAFFPAGAAVAAAGCGDGAELVADGVCEVTFAETPDSAWTPPAGITKLQALLVGGGGAVGAIGQYGGGGGEVVLVELSPTGEVDVTVGTGGVHDGDIESSGSTVVQGSTSETANGGENSATQGLFGGDSGNGNAGDLYGSGAGAGTDASDDAAGEGVIVNEIDADFDLFADDDRCFGGGGVDFYAYEDEANSVTVETVVVSCDGDNGGYLTYPVNHTVGDGFIQFSGVIADSAHVETLPNTGNGGMAADGLLGIREDGSDGVVIVRYDAQLASTGFDSLGALAAGSALIAGGVALAARRGRATR